MIFHPTGLRLCFLNFVSTIKRREKQHTTRFVAFYDVECVGDFLDHEMTETVQQRLREVSGGTVFLCDIADVRDLRTQNTIFVDYIGWERGGCFTAAAGRENNVFLKTVEHGSFLHTSFVTDVLIDYVFLNMRSTGRTPERLGPAKDGNGDGISA